MRELSRTQRRSWNGMEYQLVVEVDGNRFHATEVVPLDYLSSQKDTYKVANFNTFIYGKLERMIGDAIIAKLFQSKGRNND